MAATELEFIVFRDTYEEAFAKGYRDLVPANLYNLDYSLLATSRVEPLIRRIRRQMEEAGLPVENSKGECNDGQHEINFTYADALTTADRHSIYKNGAKEIAAQEGMAITFMAKYDEREGNSCHIHFSLQRQDGTALFASDQTAFERFLAGQLAALRELTLMYAPNINSYKRFAEGSFAPTAVAWGRDNRTCALRVVGHGDGLRIELRVPGADVNPYLALAAMIAAGLHGIDAELELEPPVEGNAYTADKPRVPGTLREAHDLFAGSRLAARGVRRRGGRRTTSTTPASSSRRSRRRSPTGRGSGGSNGSDARRDLRSGPGPDGVRGDARAAGHGDQARPAGAGHAAAGRARAVRAARHRPLDAAPGADRARAERAPARRARARRRHVRGRRRSRPPTRLRRAVVAHWRERCDARLAVELGVAVLAAERAEPDAIAPLDELVEAMDERLDDFAAYRQADVRFHIGLAEATGSARLVAAMTEAQGAMTDLIALHRAPARGARRGPTPSTRGWSAASSGTIPQRP